MIYILAHVHHGKFDLPLQLLVAKMIMMGSHVQVLSITSSFSILRFRLRTFYSSRIGGKNCNNLCLIPSLIGKTLFYH